MKQKLNEYLNFSLLIKRLAAGYADVLIEILARCKSYGQSALAVREYLREVIDRLQKNTLLKQLTFVGIGCDLQLAAYNRPLSFFASLRGHEPTRLVFREDTFFGMRWYYNTSNEIFLRTLSIAFDKGPGFRFSPRFAGLMRASSPDDIVSWALAHLEKQERIFSYGTTPFHSYYAEGRDGDNNTESRIIMSLVSQALAHKAMRLPSCFVSFVGSEHDLFSEPVVEFALNDSPTDETRLLLKILGQELVDQLSYVSSALRNVTSAHLFPVVASSLLHTHELRADLGELIDYAQSSSSRRVFRSRHLQRLHSRMLGRVNSIEDDTLRELHAHYLLSANDIGDSLRPLLRRQAQDVHIDIFYQQRIVAPLSARSIAELLYPFIDNAIAASTAQSFVDDKRRAVLAQLGVLSHPCTVKIFTSFQYGIQGTISGGPDSPFVNRQHLEADALLQVEIYDRGPGIAAAVLNDLATGTIQTRLPSHHLAGGRGIANTLLYLRSIPNTEYAYNGFWTIKIRCYSVDRAKEIYGLSFKGAEEIFGELHPWGRET